VLGHIREIFAVPQMRHITIFVAMFISCFL
jgi:hypothetical protein